MADGPAPHVRRRLGRTFPTRVRVIPHSCPWARAGELPQERGPTSGRAARGLSRPRSAAQVQAGALRRDTGETIRAALLSADLRDFTALSEATEPAAVITALGAGFDRVAGAVHAFGGEVLKFIGDGVLAIFPVTGAPARACGAALRAVVAARAGMAHLDAVRQAQGTSGIYTAFSTPSAARSVATAFASEGARARADAIALRWRRL